MKEEVKNVVGSSKEDHGFVGWIEAYKKLHSLPLTCPACGKKCDEFVGAHVIKTNGDATEYIAPLCKKCNAPTNMNVMHIDGELLQPVWRVGVEKACLSIFKLLDKGKKGANKD